jgi:hypothetical protein
MTSVRLNPWPFGNKVVKLHWFGHIRLAKNNKWNITVAFEDRHNIELIRYPIGLLPILKVGQYYQNGQALVTQKSGFVYDVYVKNLRDGYTKEAIEVCRHFKYYLYKKAELINQKVWCFKSQGIHYYIPYIELLRALFARNKVLANALLRPSELELMLDDCQIYNRRIELVFSKQIPASIISSDFVQHYLWIYLLPEIKNSFESVQSSTYANAVKLNRTLESGQAIDFIVPELLGSNWTFRGNRFGQHVLIYELISFSANELPVDTIYYSHPSIKRYLYSNNPRCKHISYPKKNHTYDIDNNNGNQAKEDTNQPVVESEVNQMIFENKPEIIRVAKYEQQINTGKKYVQHKGRGGAVFTDASVDEPITAGNIQPVEFKTLDVTNKRSGFGLEDFYKMIRQLERMYPELELSMNLVNLPLGRKFSWLPDGRRRICALVRVGRAGRISYILEVARPDQRFLSTLILKLNKAVNRKHEEVILYELLYDLVFNSGNWPKESLKKYSYKTVRHSNTEPRYWAERIYSKIMV